MVIPEIMTSAMSRADLLKNSLPAGIGNIGVRPALLAASSMRSISKPVIFSILQVFKGIPVCMGYNVYMTGSGKAGRLLPAADNSTHPAAIQAAPNIIQRFIT